MNSPKTDQTTYNVHNSLQISNYYYIKEIHVFNKLTNTQYNNKEKKLFGHFAWMGYGNIMDDITPLSMVTVCWVST